MKTLSTTARALWDDPRTDFFLLFDLNLPNPAYYTTTPWSLTFNGNTYNPDHKILAFDPPFSATSVDKNPYKLTLSDHDGAIAGALDGKVAGLKAEVRLGVLQDGKTPLLGVDDLLLVYSGFLDSYNAQTVDSWGDRVIQLEFASPMADLDAVNARYTSKSSHDSIDPNDTAFDYVFDGAEEINLEWGRAS